MEIKLNKGTRELLTKLIMIGYRNIYKCGNEAHVYKKRDMGDFIELDKLKQYGIDMDCLEKNKVYLIKNLLGDDND